MRHANSTVRAATAALVGVLVLGLTAAADPPPKDAEALERSLDMLHLQMKMKVLQTYSERANFYIPPQWAKSIQDEHQALVAQTSDAAAMQNADPDKWLAESRKTRENEVLAMYKLVETNIPRLLKGDKHLQEYKQFQQQLGQWQRDHNANTLEVARYVEGLVRPIMQANKGEMQDAYDILWWRSARNIYRGAIKDTDDLIGGITAFDKERMDVEARLVLLKEYETGLQIAKGVQDPIGTLADKAQEQALDKLQKWLKDNYTDIDEAKVKMYWGWGKDGFTAMKGLWEKYKDLDQDVTLKGNPNAMAIAKRFAVLGAAYKYTLGLVKDTAVMKAFGPITDFLEFYGEAISILPDVAVKTQAMVNKVDQDFKNVRATDPWRSTEKPPGDLRQLTTFDTFGLQVATDASIDEMTGPNARFYMLVEDKAVMPRGYALFNAEQFNRMSQAIADERFLNAPGEAWRWQTDWVLENMFEWRNTNPLSPVASPAYLDDLTKKSRKTPFTSADLVALANNQPVTINGKQWTPDSLRKEADSKLDMRADELAVRTAIAGYKQQDMDDWTAYKIILRRRGVAFTPDQIVKLFNYYHQSGANATNLLVYLAAVGDERSARARGTVRVGIPLVASDSREEAIKAGSTVKLTAHVIVSDLAPGRTVEGKAIWTLPKWATQPADQAITLTNGFQQVTCDLVVPKDARGEDIQVKLSIRVPIEKGEDAVFDAINGLKVKAVHGMGPSPGLVAAFIGVVAADAPAKPEFREFAGVGTVDVGPAGPLQITVHRLNPFSLTAIEVQSEALLNLNPDQPREGIKFILYRATSPDGPWTNPLSNPFNGNAAVVVFPGNKPMTDRRETNTGLIDKGRVRIIDLGAIDPKAPHKPFYYRVGQVGFSVGETSGHDVGEEVTSNVVAPDTTAVVLFSTLPDKPDTPDVGHSNYWAMASASLSLPNQAFDIHDAHLVVTAGGWTGHYWSRTDGNGFVRIGGPYKYDGTSITVSASGENYSGSGTAAVPGDAKQAADARKQADEATAKIASQEKYYAKELETSKKREAELVAEIAKITDTSSYSQADQLYRAQETLVNARASIRSNTELNGQYSTLRFQQEAAYATQDYAQCLALKRQEMDFLKLKRDITVEAVSGREAAISKLLARSDVPADKRKQYEGDLKDYVRERESAGPQFLQDQTGQFAAIAEAAWLAGDASGYLDARTEQVRLLVQRGLNDAIPSILLDAAEKYATLSGDRDGAAKMYLMAQAAAIERAPADQRAQVQKYWEDDSTPTWLPPDFKRKSPAAGVPNDADFAALHETAKKALESKRPPTTNPA